jgi:hypothetical protein
MSNRISRNEFRHAIDCGLSGLRADPWLARRVVAFAKEEPSMAKKCAVSTVLVIILVCVLIAGALAATLGTWGIIDFAGRYSSYIPPTYEESITHEDLTLENDSLSCTVQESYFDGRILRVAARVVSKTGALLLASDCSPYDPVSDLFNNSPEKSDSEIREETIGAYALRMHEGRLAAVRMSIEFPWEEEAMDLVMNADGSCTVYLECQCPDEQPQIEAPLTITYRPMNVTAPQSEQEEMRIDMTKPTTISAAMTFRSVGSKVFVCDTPIEFQSAGVRVTWVEMTVTPLEIRYFLDFEVTDIEAFQAQDGGLWFEFIDPDSTNSAPYDQRVSNGLTSYGIVKRLDGNDGEPIKVGAVYRQCDSIGLDALSEKFTIRAFNAWEKDRYETVTFSVREAE